MCGIVYEHNLKGKPVNNNILQVFDKQRARGTQGFGLFDGQENHIVHETKEDNILKWLVKYDSNLIMFHHRFPTSTINVKRAAHPFSTRDYFGDNQYILIHNGHVSNAKELFGKHQELGIEYRSLLDDMTFNDSETLLWDFALTMEGKQKKLQARGGIALVCIKLNKGKLNKLFFARNTNPLKLVKTKEQISLASQGDGEDIMPNKLYIWDYKTKKLTDRWFEVPGYSFGGSYSGSYSIHPISNAPVQGELISEDRLSWFKQQRQKLLKANASKLDNQVFSYSADEIVKILKKYKPTISEIQTVALDYLNVANGHFESAYFSLEADYIDLETKAQFLADYRYLQKLEQAQRYLENDPDYVNEHSLSSMWVKEGNEASIFG